MLTTIKPTKSLKDVEPVDCDMHLKYICPNSNCLGVHWLKLAEARTPDFKVVCYCGVVFQPKQVTKVKITHLSQQEKSEPLIPVPVVKPKQPEPETSRPVVPEIKPIDIVDKDDTPIDLAVKYDFFIEAVNALTNFGYSEKESTNMIREQYIKTKEKNSAKLVKLALNFFGANND